jgi:replicative DNA helicase
MSELLADPDAEERYLSACLLSPAAIDSHPALASDLWSPSHRLTFGAMVAIHCRGEAVTATSLRIELARRGELERAGGDEALTSLVARVESDPKACVARIRELAALRRGRDHALRAAAAYASADVPEARRCLDMAAGEGTRDESVGSAKDAVAAALMELRDRAKRDRPPYVATGIRVLDATIIGVEYGDLWVLGGDTSVGKTSTALMMAFAMSRAGHRPGVVSMEDAKPRMGRRILSMLSGLPAAALRKGDLTPWQWEAADQAVTRVKGTNISIAYRIGETLTEAVDAVGALKREYGCDVIFLDYAQAVRVPKVDERIAMREVCAAFKRECNRGAPAAGFLLSQLRRRDDTTVMPTRRDLYESGYLEQKADGIVLLWRPADDGKVSGVLDKAKDDAVGVTFALDRDARSGLLRET